MIKVLRNQLFAIPEQGGQWLRNVQLIRPIIHFINGTLTGIPLKIKCKEKDWKFLIVSWHTKITILKSFLLIEYNSDQEKEIYEKLLTCNYLTVKYEFPVNRDGELKYPDFTIVNRINRKTYYWEHFGMTHASSYLDSMTQKIEWYKINGFRTVEEGGNLIFTIYSDLKKLQRDIDKYIEIITH